MSDTECRLNAVAAVEHDPVRRHEKLASFRLAAAVLVSPRVDIAEALLAGVAVPAARLDRAYRTLLELDGLVTLDDELALQVVAAGPAVAASVRSGEPPLPPRRRRTEVLR